MVRVKNPQDFWAGLLFLVVGLAAVYFGRNYSFGTATKMGPGYLPTVLSWMMAGIGAFLALRALFETGPEIEPSLFRPQAFIIAAIVIFGLLIERTGLALSVLVVSVVAAFASREMRWKETAILAVGLAILCALLFVKILGQPLDIFKWDF
jgi:putative tricarboxylic transport membrane protein